MCPVNLQNKNQFLIITPVMTASMTFDGKKENFELLEDLLLTMIQRQFVMTEQMNVSHFNSLLRKGAIQTFRNINSTNFQILELVIFRRQYVKPESQATAKHKRDRLFLDTSTMNLLAFLEEPNQGAEKAFVKMRKTSSTAILFAKLPSKLKRSVNMARLKNETLEEIVAHLKSNFKPNALEELDHLHMATMASTSGEARNLLLIALIPKRTLKARSANPATISGTTVRN